MGLKRQNHHVMNENQTSQKIMSCLFKRKEILDKLEMNFQNKRGTIQVWSIKGEGDE